MGSNKDDTLIDQDPDFFKGKDTFTFSNGDLYEGEYCAHRSGIVWREGTGTYTTNDGQIYKGIWVDDKLSEHMPIEVTYPNGAQFQGYLVNNKYDGPGMYIFENKITILCDFNRNKPIGEISLIDIKGREWHGIAEDSEAVFLPEHVYFNNIHNDAGKGKQKYIPFRAKLSEMNEMKSSITIRSKSIAKFKSRNSTISRNKIAMAHTQSRMFSIVIQPSLIETTKSFEIRKGESKVFNKTKKTASDLQLEKSNWYQNYMHFKDVYDKTMEKINTTGIDSLEDDEKRWYGKYAKFKKRYMEIMEARENKKNKISKEQLFDLLNTEGIETECPPVHVVYATGDCDSICECDSSEEG